ncbi:VIR protein [Plasmodium vivax]|uniref:VIR protein n=1 Tax=Plasmodium vivax TaxID=5855 RepID=A0A1G4GSG5_PLAVI|nr:VIR protein [Plasmodium vivax]
MDIDGFIKDYPFLRNMVIAYKEFNKTVTKEDRTFDSTLMNNLKTQYGYEEKHKDIYEKIIRNLNFLLNKKYTDMGIHEYCRFLNQFIYHKKKKYNLNEFTISLFYDASHANIVRKGAIGRCPYHSYDTTYKEPLKIIKLDNFHENIQDIKSILKSEIYHDNSPCQKYICECVKIYKTMYSAYCPYEGTTDKILKETCDILEKFKRSYMAFLFGQDGIKDKIPPLNDSDIDDFPRCLSDKSKPELGSELGSAQSPVRGAGLGLEQHSQATSPASEQSNSPTSLSTSTVVSTMVGIPPFLALIYKFTPVGRMFRSKNNRSMNIFNNIDDQIEKELSYPSHKNAIINSRVATYNVAYGSV